MSWVWTIMLSFGQDEYWVEGEDEAVEKCEALDNINAWLEADKFRMYGRLTDLTGCATGNKVGMNASVFGGGFKHFDIEEFLAVVKKQWWHDPDSVQLFVKGEEDQRFTLLVLADL